MTAPLMTDKVFEILRSAVNLARDEQIRSLATLKTRLRHFYPGCETEVDEAINAWAEYVQANARR